MEYKTFIEIALSLQKNHRDIRALYELGIDLIEFPIFERYGKNIDLLLLKVEMS